MINKELKNYIEQLNNYFDSHAVKKYEKKITELKQQYQTKIIC